VTGDVTTHRLTADEARALTSEIQQSAERTHALLLRAHEGEAWVALGYASWRDYATAEFNMSQSRAYQLLDQARVVRAIESASDSTNVELPNEGQARELVRVPEPDRAAVWRETVQRTGGLPTAAAVRETYAARTAEVIDAELVDAELVDEPAARRYSAPPAPERAPDRQPRVDVSRTVLVALTELRQTRESLRAITRGQLAREDEETRRIWAARLNAELEALHGFHDSLIKENSQ
jgi:hypothetical protein